METSRIVLSIPRQGLASLPWFLKRKRGKLSRFVAVGGLLAIPQAAQASIFHGETLDKVADVLTWVVLVIAPLVGIGVFLLIHILPEKIAEKKQHPQTKAIQCLCLLSLVFGGILWPLAWLWAYTKPVVHKLAYGTDKVEHGHDEEAPPPTAAQPTPNHHEAEEMDHLRRRVAELETELADKAGEKKRF